MESRRIRALRPAKERVDPWRPLEVLVEEERTAAGRRVPALTVFLAGAECPFTCVFCDLWRHTLEGPTPAGAVARQVAVAMEEAPPEVLAGGRIKLYNASNFFDLRAVPAADEEELVRLLAPFRRVVVESHPRLVGERCLAFARALAGELEVAMGLETVHPEVLPRLNKGMTLGDFDDAAARLQRAGIALRAFVLVGAPFIPPGEAAAWAVRSAAHAFARGAEAVSLIPVRGGNGALEELAAAGDFVPPSLAQLEAAFDGALALGAGVVTVDLWEIERFTRCAACAGRRLERLERMNRSGRPEAVVTCRVCGHE